jgi:hypothetical protein
MLASGDGEARFATGYRPGSPQFGAITAALAGPADVSDAVAMAVQAHDRIAQAGPRPATES